MLETIQRVSELQAQAQNEFNAALDYYWKAPNLIEYETSVELLKLDEYHGEDKHFRDWRWQHESQGLNNVFPFLIATGALYSALALFEVLLLKLALLQERDTGGVPHEMRVHGTARILAYFRARGVSVHEVPLWSQVQAALKIRNCLTHSSGYLAHTRNAVELRQIVARRGYLSADHRHTHRASDPDDTEIRIVGTGASERVQIGTRYGWLVTSYLRDFFHDLCSAAI